MLNDSPASMLLRQAYVQHIISKHLCHRIFQPFLFSLGKRYDKADTFFQAMSNQLREKSTRKEAVWRHYTLLAGYTASNAKKNAQVAAASVIEEIAAYVKPFADAGKMDVITSGITRIVKYAVETWRYARMEREIISAAMCKDDTEENWWVSHDYSKTQPYANKPHLLNLARDFDGDRHTIIHLLPVFYREGTLPSLHRPNAELDSGCVFSKGVVLHTDCLPVLHRKKEMRAVQGAQDLEEMREAEREATRGERERAELEARQRAEAIARETREENAREEAARAQKLQEKAEKLAKELETAERLAAEEAEAEAARITAEAEAEAEAARVTAEAEAEAEAARITAEAEAEAEAARVTAEVEAESAAADDHNELTRQVREELEREIADNDAMGLQTTGDEDQPLTDEDAAAVEAAIEAAVDEKLAEQSVIGGVEIHVDEQGELY